MRFLPLLTLLSLGCTWGTKEEQLLADSTIRLVDEGASTATDENVPALAATAPGQGGPARHVVGLVTAVDGLDVTISASDGEHKARLAPGRTRYFGRRGQKTSSSALRVASRVRGSVALDGTWVSFQLRSP